MVEHEKRQQYELMAVDFFTDENAAIGWGIIDRMLNATLYIVKHKDSMVYIFSEQYWNPIQQALDERKITYNWIRKPGISREILDEPTNWQTSTPQISELRQETP